MFSLKNFLTKQSTSITFILGTIVLTVLSFQGFDVCDEGWILSSYQQIFNTPESVEYNFSYWLTTIVGGLWIKIFPSGGILSFRLLGIITLLITIVICYKLLKQHIPHKIIFMGLFMALFVNDFGHLIFYYNQFSGLLAILITYTLFHGLIKNKPIFIALAGCLTSIAIFARLPNIMLFGLVLAIPFHTLLYKKSWQQATKTIAIYIIGSLLGFSIIWLALKNLEHISIIQNAFMEILAKGQNKDSNHNFSTLIAVYLNIYLKIFMEVIKICIILIFTIACKNLFKHPLLVKASYIISFLLLILLFKNNSVYPQYALIFIGFSVVFILKNIISKELLTLSFFGFLIANLLPLGSDGGIGNVGYICIWLASPIALFALSNLAQIPMREIDLKKILPRTSTVIISLIFLSFTW